jgi:formylmethanofuran dehydrogenase subunit C
VSGALTLVLRAALTEPIDVEGFTADRLASLSEREIAGTTVWLGRRQAQLGDFFDVRGGHNESVRVEGDLSKLRGLAVGMAGGELFVDGDVGDDVGGGMSGGVLRVTGNAGDRLGAALPGASKGMTGGEIVVAGSVGREAAARARRGLVVVGGNAGADAGRSMIAGSLIVLDTVGSDPGILNKRGSIVGVGGVSVPETYRYACTYRPPHLRLTMTYLRRRYDLKIEDRVAGGQYRRYCGDAGDPGKGEILQWVAE